MTGGGANSATTISFSDEVIIGGKTVPAGKYGLLTIPGEKQWIIILSKQTNVTSPADYKADQDFVRVTAASVKAKSTTETFSLSVQDVKPTSCNLVLSWEKRNVSRPIATDIDSKIMANITLSGPMIPQKTVTVPIQAAFKADLGKQTVAAEMSSKFDESSIQARFAATKSSRAWAETNSPS